MATVQGQYKGKDIFAGDDAYIAQQMKAIDTPSPTPQIPATIGTSSLQSTQSLTIPSYNSPTPVPTPPPPAPNFGVEPAQKNYDSTLSQVESMFNQQGEMTERQQSLEQSTGFNDQQKRVQELYNIDAQYAADLSNIASTNLGKHVAEEGRLAPMFAVRGQQAEYNRQAIIQQQNVNIQRATNAALITAAQGNLAQTQNYIQRALDLEFKPLESKIEFLKDVLTQNANTLSDARKNQLQYNITEQTRQYNESLQNKNDIYTIMVEAQKGGADNQTLQKIQSATTREAAIQAASGFIQGSQQPASVEEYQFAVKNGYKGSFTDYQNEDANRKARVAGAGVVTQGAPTSYKEWELAGKPGSYEQWLKDSNVKAPTVAQQTVATYAARIEQANPTIDTLTQKISAMNPAYFEAQQRLPSYLQSAEFQQYDQAARNFINAVLRRESGAVISPSEFDNAYKQYLPRAGDTAATLAEKKKNRDIVYQSLRNAAGNAYQSVDELVGGGTKTSTQNPLGI